MFYICLCSTTSPRSVFPDRSARLPPLRWGQVIQEMDRGLQYACILCKEIQHFQRTAHPKLLITVNLNWTSGDNTSPLILFKISNDRQIVPSIVIQTGGAVDNTLNTILPPTHLSLQKIWWFMTIKFRHRSLKNRHKAVSMTISNNIMYWASQITPRDVS